ncbi:MAG: DinB family protein [Cyclobacteriaceae bacterium]
MKERADTWQMELANIAWEFEETLKKSDLIGLNKKPDPKSWSVSEIIAHLIKVNTSYFPTFDNIISKEYKTPLIGKIPFLGRKMGELLLQAMSSSKKTKTFTEWIPNEKMYDQSLYDAFFNQQHELSSYVQQLEPFLGKKFMISSPATFLVVYGLDQAIEIILAHEKRHLEQVKLLLNDSVL